jgi:hypothetical protein
MKKWRTETPATGRTQSLLDVQGRRTERPGAAVDGGARTRRDRRRRRLEDCIRLGGAPLGVRRSSTAAARAGAAICRSGDIHRPRLADALADEEGDVPSVACAADSGRRSAPRRSRRET